MLEQPDPLSSTPRPDVAKRDGTAPEASGVTTIEATKAVIKNHNFSIVCDSLAIETFDVQKFGQCLSIKCTLDTPLEVASEHELSPLPLLISLSMLPNLENRLPV